MRNYDMFNLRQSLISLAIGLGILGVGASSSLPTDKPWTVGYCTASTSFVKPTVELGFPYANLEAKLVYGQYGRSWRYSDVSVVFNQVVNTVRKVKAGEVLAVAYGHDITPTYKLKLRWDDRKPDRSRMIKGTLGGEDFLEVIKLSETKSEITSETRPSESFFRFFHPNKARRRLVKYDQLIVRVRLETEGYIFFKFDLVDAERAINQIKDDCSRVPKNKHPQEF